MILEKRLLPSLNSHHYCLHAIVSEVGVAATSTEGGTLISLFDRADPVQASNPFMSSINIFVVAGQRVLLENQFDGSFETLPDMAPAN
ncbi:MAG: hypothetical protein WAM82_26225 [Thermoanaerobaculia bacterium]